MCTGRKRDARSGAGTSTDMTAALLVMESLLEARAPAIPRAGKPTAQQDIPVHGNYKRYYGYRWGSGGDDPRLQVWLATRPVSIHATLHLHHSTALLHARLMTWTQAGFQRVCWRGPGHGAQLVCWQAVPGCGLQRGPGQPGGGIALRRRRDAGPRHRRQPGAARVRKSVQVRAGSVAVGVMPAHPSDARFMIDC